MPALNVEQMAESGEKKKIAICGGGLVIITY